MDVKLTMGKDEEAHLVMLMKWYADAARNFYQISVAALAVPLVLSDKLHHANALESPHLRSVLVATWVAFAIAALCGSFYQYFAIKCVELSTEPPKNVATPPGFLWLVEEPGYLFATLLVAFVAGTIGLGTFAVELLVS